MGVWVLAQQGERQGSRGTLTTEGQHLSGLEGGKDLTFHQLPVP